MDATDRDMVAKTISQYIGENFLDGSDLTDLSDDTPLLEWGILSSVNTSMLVNHIRTQFEVVIPPTHLTARNFTDVRAITDMVCGLAGETP